MRGSSSSGAEMTPLQPSQESRRCAPFKTSGIALAARTSDGRTRCEHRAWPRNAARLSRIRVEALDHARRRVGCANGQDPRRKRNRSPLPRTRTPRNAPARSVCGIPRCGARSGHCIPRPQQQRRQPVCDANRRTQAFSVSGNSWLLRDSVCSPLIFFFTIDCSRVRQTTPDALRSCRRAASFLKLPSSLDKSPWDERSSGVEQAPAHSSQTWRPAGAMSRRGRTHPRPFVCCSSHACGRATSRNVSRSTVLRPYTVIHDAIRNVFTRSIFRYAHREFS